MPRHLQSISIALNPTMIRLNTSEFLTFKIATISKTENPALKDIYSLKVSQFMRKCNTSQGPANFND